MDGHQRCLESADDGAQASLGVSGPLAFMSLFGLEIETGLFDFVA